MDGDFLTLSGAENHLQKHFGEKYNDNDWQPALKAVMNAEGHITKAQEAIDQLALASHLPKLTIKLSAHHLHNPQLDAVKAKLMESVNKLVKQKQIFEQAPSLKDLLNPVEETEDSDSAYRFEGGDAEIIATVQQEMAEQREEVLEIEESDDEEKADPYSDCSIAELIALTEKLKWQSLKYADADFPLELPQQLQRFQAQLKHKQIHTRT
ncbi:hypothetical protein C0995_016220 [Termitomyces sp. Mi166|nr:hypothetical protein C0995_016220 [Termitomyces sp. Mi166\